MGVAGRGPVGFVDVGFEVVMPVIVTLGAKGNIGPVGGCCPAGFTVLFVVVLRVVVVDLDVVVVVVAVNG